MFLKSGLTSGFIPEDPIPNTSCSSPHHPYLHRHGHASSSRRFPSRGRLRRRKFPCFFRDGTDGNRDRCSDGEGHHQIFSSTPQPGGTDFFFFLTDEQRLSSASARSDGRALSARPHGTWPRLQDKSLFPDVAVKDGGDGILAAQWGLHRDQMRSRVQSPPSQICFCDAYAARLLRTAW